jgi:hypothetical protein
MELDKRHFYGRLGVGLFLLFAGIALMLDKFDIFNAGPVWHYWPIIIIAVGLGRLLDAQLAWEYRKACWILFIGAWLFISELHIFGLDYHDSWPILLIGVGIGMLWKSAYPSHVRFAKDHCNGN